jgi:hypothetical protein
MLPYILYCHRCYILWHYWCSIILFSFPSFSKYHRVVPLLQTCSTYEFVYDNTCFYVYVYLLDLPSMYEGKHMAFVFLSPPIASIYLQTTCHYSLWVSKTQPCMCTTFSWSIHQL